MKNKTASLTPTTTPRITKKRAYYSHVLADKARDERRSEGDARNAKWRALTPEQQIRSLATRPGNSRKQVRRITGQDLSAAEVVDLIDKKGLKL